MFSSCGPAQWRLNGLDAIPHEAAQQVRSVPVPPSAYVATLLLLLLFIGALVLIVTRPWAVGLVMFPLIAYKILQNKNHNQ